jgi:hypothetical protein
MTEHRANESLADTHATTLRFKRSLAEAFPAERACAVEHYMSQRFSHRLLRALRSILRRFA